MNNEISRSARDENGLGIAQRIRLELLHDLIEPFLRLLAFRAQIGNVVDEKEGLEFFDNRFGQIILHIARVKVEVERRVLNMEEFNERAQDPGLIKRNRFDVVAAMQFFERERLKEVERDAQSFNALLELGVERDAVERLGAYQVRIIEMDDRIAVNFGLEKFFGRRCFHRDEINHEKGACPAQAVESLHVPMPGRLRQFVL